MRNKTIMKLTAAMLIVTLTGCNGSSLNNNTVPDIGNTISEYDTSNSADGAVEDSHAMTVGETADYFINASDDYTSKENSTADRAAVLEGLTESKPATQLQMLVLAGRVFGSLPAPAGNAERIAPPPADLSGVPEWAVKALDNLNQAGILADSDLETKEKMETIATLKDAKMITARIFALFGTNLKDDFYTAVNKNELDTLEIPEGETTAGGSGSVSANTNKQLHDLIMEIVNQKEDYPHGSPEQKIRDLYHNVLNTDARNQEGIKPLKKYLDAVEKAADYETMEQLAQTDLHAPNKLRCNRVLANFQEFFDTYGIGPGDGMYIAPKDRIKIW